MKTAKRRAFWILVAAIIVLVGVPGVLTYREMQHARASATLIAALKRVDTAAALAALDAGANPNAREGEQAASVWQILGDFWKGEQGALFLRDRLDELDTVAERVTKLEAVVAGNGDAVQN